MSSAATPIQLTPADVERASEHDAKNYELLDGELKEKPVGFKALLIATRISERLNSRYYPAEGAAAVEAMVYCFSKPNHGRKPDVTFITRARLPNGRFPDGDIHIAPDLVVEVLSPGNSGIELDEKLNEYLIAGVPMVWIVNPDRQTIRIYRNDGTTQLFRGQEVIENQPGLPGFRLVPADVFPPA